MLEYPLIRFDNRQWLEKLQNGELFMRSSLYYQKMESDDLARSDPFDGSIPFPDTNGVMKTVSGKTTSNERLTLLDRYVKCFYHCTSADFILTEGGLLKLNFSEAAKKMIREFHVDSAMLIFAPSMLISQVEAACNQKQEQVWFDDVRYISDDEYISAVQSLLMNPRESYKLPFYKDIRFSSQKEFRICIQHPFSEMDYTSSWINIPASVIELPYAIEIGSIEDSYILSIDNLLSNGCLLDAQHEHYYVCEDS